MLVPPTDDLTMLKLLYPITSHMVQNGQTQTSNYFINVDMVHKYLHMYIIEEESMYHIHRKSLNSDWSIFRERSSNLINFGKKIFLIHHNFYYMKDNLIL